MRHSIFSVILSGIIIGALFFFMPKLVLGIFIFLVIIRLLHVGHMGHRWYDPGYYGHHGYSYGCGYRESDENGGSGHDKDYNFHHKHHHSHHHGHGPMEGPLYYWADKIRNMSEEEYSVFRDKMEKGFGHGYYGGRPGSYDRCKCGRKSEADCDCNSDTKKEDTTQNNDSK